MYTMTETSISHTFPLSESANYTIIAKYTLRQKATIGQITTMQATSKNVLFAGHNHLLTTGTDDPSLWL